MAHHVVLYRYTDDVTARDDARADHRSYLSTLLDSGELLVSGPTNGSDGVGAMLIVNAESADRVAELLDVDPFATRGVIAERTILEYTVVFGSVG
ncbi:YciI family protein [Salinibacterium hongtaonis]|uniref:YCII-related domain-containing protein n=1 Tax=Homoserinimonas hongtaonis TaxID=2079791 RepID=A0A2U1T2C4_9MICO|nr:YciI family protein [Salinibacterium hongtaonis]AWB88174.1 hypothetical protein C2138_00180 [Salinibacterium hongtaonis]PWB97913.1 hypothetical protein DF220_08775 [Salinibacterium hongtaonis]